MKDIDKKLHIISRKEEEDLTQIKAKNLSLPYLDLTFFPLNPSVIQLINEKDARNAGIIVLDKIGNHMKVACLNCADDLPHRIITTFKDQGIRVDEYIVSESSIHKAWQFYQSVENQQTMSDLVIIHKDFLDGLTQHITDLSAIQQFFLNKNTTELIELILAGGMRMKAGDIHIESYPAYSQIRYRIDGILQDIAQINKVSYTQLLDRLKLISNVSLNITDAAQDGRFSVHIIQDNATVERIDIRISFLPEKDQESVVMRLLGVGVEKLNLENLGVREFFYHTLKEQAKKTNGMILVTGPTGSGKTTTLYALLNYLNTPEVKIITVEDPIEYQISGITQTQTSGHYSFSDALRAILRQNPNIIMVGEIRDEETAKIAVESSLTGHLVLSTLHTNNAVGTISRLLDFEVKERIISSSLNIAIAQRLVRSVCLYCKEQAVASTIQQQKINAVLNTFPDSLKHLIPQKIDTVAHAKGCAQCYGLGYKGREPVMETLIVSEQIRKLITGGADLDDIADQAQKEGNMTMMQDGILKVLSGITTLEEVERALGEIVVAE